MGEGPELQVSTPQHATKLHVKVSKDLHLAKYLVLPYLISQQMEWEHSFFLHFLLSIHDDHIFLIFL